MTRIRSTVVPREQARTRIVWRHGPFRIECVGTGARMRVSVYHGRFVMAEETVESAEMAWHRGDDICRQLDAGELAYERGSA